MSNRQMVTQSRVGAEMGLRKSHRKLRTSLDLEKVHVTSNLDSY